MPQKLRPSAIRGIFAIRAHRHQRFKLVHFHFVRRVVFLSGIDEHRSRFRDVPPRIEEHTKRFLAVSPRSPRFLVIRLERFWHRVMEDVSDIWFINPHAERNGRADDVARIIRPRILVGFTYVVV